MQLSSRTRIFVLSIIRLGRLMLSRKHGYEKLAFSR